MANYIGAIGVPLPPPTALYPPTINALPTNVGTNVVSLPAGGVIQLPPGRLLVTTGQYSVVQVKDPVSGTWMPFATSDVNAPNYFDSDGANYRVINPLGCPIGALVVNGGNSFTSAPTITATGGSTWLGIVGGVVSAINIASGGSGARYGIPPIVNISVPPNPGVQASAVCAVSGGLVTGFTIINPGAGYTSPPTVTLVPNPADANIGLITNAAAVAVTSQVGVLTAVLNLTPGLPQLTTPAITVAGGGGSGALVTAVMAYMVGGYAVTTAGSGYAGNVAIQTTGGTVTSAPASFSSPVLSNGIASPRNVNITGIVSGSGISINNNVGGGVIDGGFFLAPPAAYVVPGPGIGGVLAVVTATVSFVNDTVYITPL